MGERLRSALAGVTDAAGLEDVRVRFLGRSGESRPSAGRSGRCLPPERPTAGKTINDAVGALEALLDARNADSAAKALEEQLSVAIDVTFPGTPPVAGSIHPVRRTMDDMARYFERRGFAVVLGPESKSKYNNFDALDIPPDHPAREGLDSFYLHSGTVLRTHTSPVQSAR